MKKYRYVLSAIGLSVALFLTSCGSTGKKTDTAKPTETSSTSGEEQSEAPAFEAAETEAKATESETVAEEPASEQPSLEAEAPDSETASVEESSTEDHPEPAPVVDEKLSSVMDELHEALPTTNGDWAVYVCDLNNDSEDFYLSHSMQAASLIKLYIMGAIYEDYDAIIETYGKDDVDNNLYYMITVSDNDCANNLTSYLGRGDSTAGMQVVNDFCQAHGFLDTHMGRLLLHSNEFDDNYTSVADCGHLLKAIRQNNTAEYPHADDMFNLLSQQQRRHKLPSQLPDGVHVANKTGELDTVENDAGIIYDVANELVIVFMSEHLQDCGLAWNTIGSLTRMIYDRYN